MTSSKTDLLFPAPLLIVLFGLLQSLPALAPTSCSEFRSLYHMNRH